MEPVWSALGQAAGVAAALSVEHDLALNDVAVHQIQHELVAQKCVLFFYTDLPGGRSGFRSRAETKPTGRICEYRSGPI